MPTTAQQLATIRANQTEIIIPDLKAILANQGAIMTALDDLNAAVTALQVADAAIQMSDANVAAAVQTAITLIKSLHTGTGTVTDAEVETVVGQLTGVSSDLTKASGDFSTAVSNLGGATPQP